MDQVKLKIKVQKKIFYSEESGFAVCKVAVQDSKEHLTIVGHLLDVNEGDFLEVTGDYVDHPQFGRQLKISSFIGILPEDNEGMIKYLSSGRFKGLGRKTAKKIVSHFEKETFEILEKSPQRLHEVKGVTSTVVAEITKNFAGNRIIRELTVKLAPYGIGSETIFKISKTFGEDAFQILEQNPYQLISEVRGIGFKIADTIARGFGIAANDNFRIKAGIEFFISFVEQKNGDVYMEESDLIRRCAQLLDVDETEVVTAINEMVTENILVKELLPDNQHAIMSAKNFTIEKKIAMQLFNLATDSSPLGDIPVDYDYLAQRMSVQLTEEQQKAVFMAVNNRITVITGGPGTGKTTIIRAIIESLDKEGKHVLIAAPTGRAAKRVEEATLYHASTIHRMLKINPETRHFVHNELNPLDADAIIVDEFSMVDFFLFYSLLKSISPHSRLIIIGDKDQLPSVGPGNVLRDIIHSNCFDIIYLSRNFRQEENSLIIENAYRINNGEELIFKPYADDLEFVFIQVANEKQALEKVLRIIQYYQNDFNFNSPDFQVLVPMYRGEAGIDNINARIQELFNPGKVFLRKERLILKQWDKVMQLKNNYEKEIFNGEQGIVADYDPEKRIVRVGFDTNYIEYGVEELDELTLSYAVSVHKAQGSEYDVLLLVLLPSHAIMLNRELFYTAVTRARKKIFLISDRETVRRAVFNASPAQRKTLLTQRLTEIFEIN